MSREAARDYRGDQQNDIIGPRRIAKKIQMFDFDHFSTDAAIAREMTGNYRDLLLKT